MPCLCETIAGPGADLSPVCIGHLWVFQDLPPAEVEALALAAVRRKYKKGEAIFMQGDPARQMVLIKAGRVKLSKITENGSEITLDIRKAGDFLGENMLSEDIDYPLSAHCMEETLACGFAKERFEHLILEHPNIGLQVIKNLSRRIAWLTDHVGSMSLTNLEDRLYRVLVSVAQEHGLENREGLVIQFPLTHEDLSFLIGAHRVSVTRALKNLREAGKIIQEGKILTLPLDRLGPVN